MAHVVNFIKKLFGFLLSLLAIYILAVVNIIVIIKALIYFNIAPKPVGIPYATISFILAVLEFFLIRKFFKKREKT